MFILAMRRRGKRVIALCLASFVLTFIDARAESITLTPVADTALFEYEPNFNFGAENDLPAGTIGRAGGFNRSRILLKFDVARAIPANVVISRAVLTLTAVKSPDSPANSTLGLHRMLDDWSEGTQRGLPPGGAPAAGGETTWNSRFSPNGAWAAPGGKSGEDFVALPTASERIAANGEYEVELGSIKVKDIQDWLTAPETNFGWILISQSEDIPQTARRFASREHAASAPMLLVQFSVPPPSVPAPTITTLTVDRGDVILRFLAEAGAEYRIESRIAFETGAWEIIGRLMPQAVAGEVAATNASGSDHQRFFRVVLPQSE